MMDVDGRLRLQLVSGGQSSRPGVLRDVGRVAFNELAEEGELMVARHGIWRTANLPLCNEYLDLALESLVRPNVAESDQNI